jgi:hypothetical protein
VELHEMYMKFRDQHISLKIPSYFILYHLVALASMTGYAAWFLKSRLVKKGVPRIRMTEEEASLINVVKKGSATACKMMGPYLVGLMMLGYFTQPFQLLRKQSELQDALVRVQVRYDPFYQDIFLFKVMQKFGISK